MPDVAKLKKKAAEFELKKQFDKALAVYVEILDGYNSSDEDVDVSLFNRVGDLYLKQGSVGDAVDYYEQAVDRYAEGGFHNNAIALCNKILRNSPGRAIVYYKLGKISAQKGFKGDAKKNFLEYADRMQASGNINEAFRALKEFADLCPDQDDIRLMLADQLSRKGRGGEAIEQLQTLFERYTHDGRTSEANAAVERMRAIDPAYEPKAPGDGPNRTADDLVFLDLNDATPSRRVSAAAKRATLGLELLATGAEDVAAGSAPTPIIPQPAIPTLDVLDTPVIEPAVLDGVTRVAEFEASSNDSASLDGLEVTSLEGAQSGGDQLLDFEPTSFEGAPQSATPAGSVEASPEFIDLDMSGSAPSDSDMPMLETIDLGSADIEPPASRGRASLFGLPMLTDEDGQEPAAHVDDGETIGGDLELIMPEGTPIRGVPAQPADDLPLMDFELPVSGEAMQSVADAGNIDDINLDLAASHSADLDLDLSSSTPTPPPAPRQSTVLAAQSVELLQVLAEEDPDDNALRRRLAEAMLESGDREGGLRELETAMVGFERADDLTAAAKLADEIVLLNPASVRHHQKRVEYAFRTNERGRLIEAYLQLADALFRAGQAEKSRSIYQRVIELAPDDIRAQSALESFPAEEAPVPPPPTPAKGRTTVPSQQRTSAVAPSPKPPSGDDEYINLGDWLRDDEAPKDTRMVVDEKEPTGDEEADFQDMLRKFKQGISENVEEEDHQSHYDLGVAYKEMGLLDESIAEFQKALRAPANRVPTYEALGQCFMEKEQYPMAATILSRGLHEPGMSDDQLVGVLYLLGRCAEERGQRDAAIEYYQRVFVVDIQFRDVGERLAAVEGAAR